MFTGTGSPLRRLLGAIQRLQDADATADTQAFDDALVGVYSAFDEVKRYVSDRTGTVEPRS